MTSSTGADLPVPDAAGWRETEVRPANPDDHGHVVLTIGERDEPRYTVRSFAGYIAVERVVVRQGGFDIERMRSDVHAGTATSIRDYYGDSEVRVGRFEPLGSLAQALRVIADDMDGSRADALDANPS